MKIFLAAVDAELADAWHWHCRGVSIHRGSILDLAVDAVVSPANSFGFMDGGIDQVYLQRFGPTLESRVRERISERCYGELHVGEALRVETGDDNIPFLIVAPTMRVPMLLGRTINPYLATRAALLLASHLGIEKVAFPGMGTGVGGVSPQTCARQMRAAIESVSNLKALPESWRMAQQEHERLLGE